MRGEDIGAHSEELNGSAKQALDYTSLAELDGSISDEVHQELTSERSPNMTA